MRKRILIMDDEEDLCKEVTGYFSDLGYNADYELNGHDGIHSIETNAPDLLILDIHMPKMDGLQVMRELVERFPNLHVVVLSGVLNPDILKKCVEYGAAESVSKPVNIEELYERVIKRLIGGPEK